MKVSDSTYYALKRLHSLTGVVPVGLFLLEHLFTNSRALAGADAFNRAAEDLAALPYVQLLELFGIGVPILFHMVLGLLIATTMQANTGRHGYSRNWAYLLQRVTGIFLTVYILFHVWATRLSPEVLRGDTDLFSLMQRILEHPAMIAFYALGVIAAAYHFGNGLFGFAIHWGLATGRTAQRWAARLAFGVFLVLTLVGLNSLLAFLGHGVRWFERGGDATVTMTEGSR